MKKHLFYTLLVIFIATAAITLAGVTRFISVDKEYLTALVGALLIEIVVAIIGLFKQTNFFEDDNSTLKGDKKNSDVPEITPILAGSDECEANWVISKKNSKKEGVLVKSGDSSDLYFILLSVDDLKRARMTVADVQATKYSKVIIEAMYHLMGSWDLLIKFRANVDGEYFYHDIITALIKAGRMNEDPSHIYGRHELMNVHTQSKTISGIINPKKQEIVAYTVLANSNEYDKYRASRVFIYLQTKGKVGSEEWNLFLEHMQDAISKTYSSAIIESICVGISTNGLGETMIIETFSSCSQSNFIKHLNSAIEPVLAHYGLQKYTLACYRHDEKGLLKQVGETSESAA